MSKCSPVANLIIFWQ